ncbi:unnamed protein product [Rangifer tarandus platyrhynchus]|uniref:Basic proline-rich protein-like n=2 Tax=Rangifer tarandus platyrhynchus TaxID=3082113 RepID=A0ABN8XWK0_RANTA|nr:unnamed protein product [Rangifer tarandus platyrhynchus]CAI9713594.1 unnamed protein product [Rangifer tarandus platyrhynchus]
MSSVNPPACDLFSPDELLPVKFPEGRGSHGDPQLSRAPGTAPAPGQGVWVRARASGTHPPGTNKPRGPRQEGASSGGTRKAFSYLSLCPELLPECGRGCRLETQWARARVCARVCVSSCVRCGSLAAPRVTSPSTLDRAGRRARPLPAPPPPLPPLPPRRGPHLREGPGSQRAPPAKPPGRAGLLRPSADSARPGPGPRHP